MFHNVNESFKIKLFMCDPGFLHLTLWYVFYNMFCITLFFQRALYTVHCTNIMHSRKRFVHCGDQRHLGLCLVCVPALTYGSCRVSDQGTTLHASDLHNAWTIILNPFSRNSYIVSSVGRGNVKDFADICLHSMFLSCTTEVLGR